LQPRARRADGLAPRFPRGPRRSRPAMSSGPWPPSGADRYRAILAFVRREGHARVPQKHRERGVKLGYWVAGRRAAYKRQSIALDEVAALEAIPSWAWSVDTSHSPDAMLAALRAFARREGHARVPARHRERGLPLGTWVHKRRDAQRRGPCLRDWLRSCGESRAGAGRRPTTASVRCWDCCAGTRAADGMPVSRNAT